MSFEKKGSFSGLLVLDLTRVLAGPYAALMMAELGARVIKIEPPEGDDARRYGPFVTGESGVAKSGYFLSINRGKESIALDLKAEEDRRIFEALLARADVLIENYRGGTMEKLGYGWDSLKDKYPRLIYASVSGFGHTGPYAARPAYDMVVQAMGASPAIREDLPPASARRSVISRRHCSAPLASRRRCTIGREAAGGRKWMWACSIAR